MTPYFPEAHTHVMPHNLVFSKWRDFIQLDELDRLNGMIHAWNRIQLQPRTSTENILVRWLRSLTAKQAIWVQFLLKSLTFLKISFCWICKNRRELWKNSNELHPISAISLMTVWSLRKVSGRLYTANHVFLACRVPWVSPMATGVTINH